MIGSNDFSGLTVGNVLDRPVREMPGATALVAVDGRLTYAELDGAVDRTAQALLSCGVRPGDRVAFSLPNVLSSVISLYATSRIGAIWVGINRHLAAQERAHMLADSGAVVLVADGATVDAIISLRAGLHEVRELLDVDAHGGRWQQLLDHATASRPDVMVRPTQIAAIAYTSGTTGFPKGAMLTHRSLLLQGSVLAVERGYDASTQFGIATSMMNIMGPMLSTLAMAQVGGRVVLIDHMHAGRVAEWVDRERITDMPMVGALVHDLATSAAVEAGMLSSLRDVMAGAGDIAPSIIDRFRSVTGITPSVGYGQTEVPGAATIGAVGATPVAGSSGRALPHLELAILDDAGTVVEPGQEGEICVRPAHVGPWAGMYQPLVGYWNRPDDTRQVLRGDWLHTGDLGSLDENSELFVSGRVSALIVRGGANVYPAEVERVLVSEEGVGAVVVVGVPDTRLGERVVALIEPTAGMTVDVDECRARCRAALAHYKQPEELILVDHLPRNSLGKIIRPAALALALDKLR